jgi:hypothetical protein
VNDAIGGEGSRSGQALRKQEQNGQKHDERSLCRQKDAEPKPEDWNDNPVERCDEQVNRDKVCDPQSKDDSHCILETQPNDIVPDTPRRMLEIA